MRCLEDSYDIEIAYDRDEAISKINIFNPAVILLDIMMPWFSGDNFLKMIKGWKPEIHIIMISAYLTPEFEKVCMQNLSLIHISEPTRPY